MCLINDDGFYDNKAVEIISTECEGRENRLKLMNKSSHLF